MDHSSEEMILDPRRAGRVLRYHTWPHIRPQTVAEHGWQVARILLAWWPSASQELVNHCLFHDVGEVAAGDVPFPAKRDDEALRRTHDSTEMDAYLKMTIP